MTSMQTKNNDEIINSLRGGGVDLLNSQVEAILNQSGMEFFRDIYRFMEGKVFFVKSEVIPIIQGGVSGSGDGDTVYIGDVDDNSETSDQKFAVARHLLRFATFEYLTLGRSNQISVEDRSAIRSFSNLIAVYLMAKINPDFLDDESKGRLIRDAVEDLDDYPDYSAALRQAISNEPGLNNLRNHLNFFSVAVKLVWQHRTVFQALDLFLKGNLSVATCFKVFDPLDTVADKLEKENGVHGLLISDHNNLIDYFPQQIKATRLD